MTDHSPNQVPTLFYVLAFIARGYLIYYNLRRSHRQSKKVCSNCAVLDYQLIIEWIEFSEGTGCHFSSRSVLWSLRLLTAHAWFVEVQSEAQGKFHHREQEGLTCLPFGFSRVDIPVHVDVDVNALGTQCLHTRP